MTTASSLLADASLEIMPRNADMIPLVADSFPSARVYVTLIDPDESSAQEATARRLTDSGLRASPHIPARLTRSRSELRERVKRLSGECGVDDLLLIGGDRDRPLGEFDAVSQLLAEGDFAASGIRRLGFAGHPEGNAAIESSSGKSALLDALRLKRDFAADSEIECRLTTQVVFTADPIFSWAKTLRDEGIHFPIHVGLAGPATLRSLVRFAAMCGAGASARFIRRQARNVAKLMSVSTPDETLESLASGMGGEFSGLGVSGAHFYPFGGIERLATWRAARMAQG